MTSGRIDGEALDIGIGEADIVQFLNGAIGRGVIVEDRGNDLCHDSHSDVATDGRPPLVNGSDGGVRRSSG